MSINFEAANMAGYNNPKIEVFRATVAASGTKLAQYPEKAAIIAAINRGSIPVIHVTRPGVDGGFVLPLCFWTSIAGEDVITFSVGVRSVGEYAILYPPDSGTPTFTADEP